ncbi:protein tramtrack, alpha isoform isoform X2 [Dendroctonus ponderosae]|uniref:BTB domain-containing protein n=1 Tax=Dendroctonus ponderosae TaxID=77166 RepID=A0AAR5PGR7_DENPD|nr:protein tramtrack, alpha isoform isoform X2 [Dendroctonus ponderosae]
MSAPPYSFQPDCNQPLPAATAPASMATQRFCLRWNNHQSNLLSVFDQLLHDESFVDVTLAVEGQLLRAHKMVLSACSPYFQGLFMNHPDKHPIVILKDVPYSDMKCLLDFMYRGEVSVDQDRLTHFLRVAESLRIKGLTEVNEEKCDNIANSLSQQNAKIPNLQRIQQQQNKRFAAAATGSMNMLGNYLMQPKRKRGRPRRLSGNSNGDESEAKDSIVHGSPEMLEVKMGMDGFTGNNSDGSTNKEDEDGLKVKEEEDEPVAGTSQEGFSERRNSDDMPVEDYLDYSQENNQNHTNLPSSLTVNLEVVPQKQETVIISTEEARNMLNLEQIKAVEVMDTKPEVSLLPLALEPEVSAGVHFLTDEDSSKSEENYEKKKWEFLEYMPQADGSVVCKRCGEVLASRTHWYRHKYKLHVNSLGSPSPLFKCELCNVFFKSRKGYMGHYSSRHNDTEMVDPAEVKEDPPENSAVPTSPPPVAKKKLSDKSCDWEEKRLKEEKLVADIINRVRRECEAQGAIGSRRGYSRRTTSLMNVNSQAC